MRNSGWLASSVPSGGSGPCRRCNSGRSGSIRSRSRDWAKSAEVRNEGSLWLTCVGVELLIDVNEDTRVGSAVGSGKADTGGGRTTPTSDVDLEASHVELSTTSASSSMECDGLSPEKVLSGRDGRGNCDGVVSTVILFDGNHQMVNVSDRRQLTLRTSVPQ